MDVEGSIVMLGGKGDFMVRCFVLLLTLGRRYWPVNTLQGLQRTSSSSSMGRYDGRRSV